MIAEAIDPTTSAPKVPENTVVTSMSRVASRIASEVLPRSYFHLITMTLNAVARPMRINSMWLLVVDLVKPSN